MTKASTTSAGGKNGHMALLMPDDFSELNLVTWWVEPGTPDADNPLIEGDMPWDAGGVGIHGSVIKDPIDSNWKAYLVSTPAEEWAENKKEPWRSDNHNHRRICLYESNDGVHWTRPELPNCPIPGHDKTNIILDSKQGVGAYASIIINPNNKEWPYEMFALRAGWAEGEGSPPQGTGYYRYRSREGKVWEAVGNRIQGPMKGDICYFYNDNDEGYVAYYRMAAELSETDHVPVYEDAPRRSCYRATSSDGSNWVKDQSMFLTADERDHRDTQYQECVPFKVKGGYLGMITMYHPITQTQDLRIAASRDGRVWWFPDRRPCLANPPLGDYGGGLMWQSQRLILDGDRLYVYYGATEGPHRQISDSRAPSVQAGIETVIDHGAHFLPFNSALCRSSWRLDRVYALISSAGGPTIGTAVTVPQPLSGKTLWVDLMTRPPKKSSRSSFDEGYIQVELIDEGGRALPGYTHDDCNTLKGDHKELQVSWKGGSKTPERAVKARFYLKRAFLYGFEFREG